MQHVKIIIYNAKKQEFAQIPLKTCADERVYQRRSYQSRRKCHLRRKLLTEASTLSFNTTTAAESVHWWKRTPQRLQLKAQRCGAGVHSSNLQRPVDCHHLVIRRHLTFLLLDLTANPMKLWLAIPYLIDCVSLNACSINWRAIDQSVSLSVIDPSF